METLEAKVKEKASHMKDKKTDVQKIAEKFLQRFLMYIKVLFCSLSHIYSYCKNYRYNK
jgi:preprotein translocase subunit SecG